jgi:glycosyltransferase involved in cell wall biosynthesis
MRLHGPDWRDRKKKVQQLVTELALERSVTVGDSVYGQAKRNLLIEAKGFVYPSRWDACPNAVLESVALGVPTLAGPYPLGQFLADRGGAFVAEAEPQSLADGLVRLMSPEAPRVAQKGTEVVRHELAWDQVAASWLEQAGTLL